MGKRKVKIASSYTSEADVVLYHGDCRDLLDQIRRPIVRLAVTSPPYNVGKEYENRVKLEKYIETHSEILRGCHRVLRRGGSLCWEVGNYVEKGEIVPLDILMWPYFSDELGMKLRNRIIWQIPHGLHAKRRFSGRYETVMWFTKGDNYYFDLDPVRVRQLYPAKKAYKGPNKGKISSNPKGKNPSDVWYISNVKANHSEKTVHPCQFPEDLVKRLVLSLTKPGDWVLDPYLGSGTTAAVCVELGRRVIGAEIDRKYINIARDRIDDRVKSIGASATPL